MVYMYRMLGISSRDGHGSMSNKKPVPIKPLTEYEAFRFLRCINYHDKQRCWEWTGNHNQYGYGIFYRKSGMRLTHRTSWYLYKGDIPENLLVLHACDNPSCVNPNHLFLGTHRDNQRDMVWKRRHYWARKNTPHNM